MELDEENSDLAGLSDEQRTRLSRLGELERQALDSESALHDSAQRIADLEAHLEAANAKHSQEGSLKTEVERLQAELVSRDRALQEGQGASRRIEEIEEEKRRLLGVTERLEGDKGELEASLQTLRNTHNSVLASLRQIESALGQSTDQERSARLRLQAAEGELEIIRRDRDWHKEELEKGTREWKTWRDDKHTQVTRLQTALETAETLATSSTASLEALRTSHDSNETRLTDAHGRIAELSLRLAEQEASFRAEIEAQKRLVTLLESRDGESSARLAEVESEWNEAQTVTDSKLLEYETALAEERARADTLQSELDILRTQGDDQTRGGVDADFFAPPSRAGTPGLAGSPAGPSFMLSPSASMAAKLQKGGRSYTEVYADYVRIQEELAAEKAENRRMGELLTNVLSDLQDRAPLFDELHTENNRLSEETNALAVQLARALEERDINERRANSLKLDFESSQTETKILSRQLNDLGRQIHVLTRTVAQFEDPSITGRSGDLMDDIDMTVSTTTDNDDDLPSELLTFTNVSQLIQRNRTLARVVRELSAKMDQRDDDALRRLQRTENEAVRDAHDTILALKDELERQRAQMEAGSREREMLRRLVSGRAAPSGLHHSINGHGGGGYVDERLNRELADVQMAFEAYKTESTTNVHRLSEDVAQARRETASASVSQAKAKAQVDFLNERLRIMNDREGQKESELAQLTRNIASLKKASAQQEQVMHEHSQSLIVARADVDRLRHELSNVRAEREVWKGTEARLVATNESLSSERAQLNDLLRTLQSMQNELESSGAASRKRLEDDVAKYEVQMADLREKLAGEQEALKQASLRREMDAKTLQDRLDRLTTEHTSTREDLLTTRHSLQQTEQRLEEGARQLASTEAKLAVYTTVTLNGGDPALTREQQLQVELADVRGELQTVKLEVEQARAHVEQLKVISQANEDALAEYTATSDEYRSTTDATLAERDAQVAQLEEQNQVISAEIEALNETNTSLHRQVEEARSASGDEVRQLQQSIAEMESAHAQRHTENTSMREALQQAEHRASDAHDKYERELVAHAENVKQLTVLKEQVQELRSSAFAQQTAAESAIAKLDAATISWNRQRDALQRDLEETRDRLQAALDQNSILHEHLEQVNATASKLKQATEGIGATDNIIEDSEKPQEIIRYLRREQEILNVQLHLDRQEKLRLTQKLEYTERNLDEARAALSAERERNADKSATAAQQAELLEKVNTLNLLRESNATLRDESERHARKVAMLESRLREIEERDAFSRGKVRDLEAEVEARGAQIKLVEEDASRWKARTTQILEKYERIDPAEFAALKEQVAALEAQRVELEERAAAGSELGRVQEDLSRQTADSIALAASNADKAEQIEKLTAQNAEARERFRSLQATARTQREQINSSSAEVESLKKRVGELEEAQGTQATTDLEVAQARADAQAELESVKEQLKQAQTSSLDSEALAKAQADLTALQDQLAQARTESAAARDSASTASQATDALRQELAAAQEQLVAAQAATAAQPAAETSNADVASEVQRILAEASVAVDGGDLSEEDRQQRTLNAQVLVAEERERAVEAAVSALRAELEQEKAAALESAATTSRAESEQRIKEVEDRLATIQNKSAEQLATLRQQHAAAVASTAEKTQKTLEASLRKARSEGKEEGKAEATAEAAKMPAAPPPADIDVEAVVASRLAAIRKELEEAKSAIEQMDRKNKLLAGQNDKLRREAKTTSASPSPATPTGKSAIPPVAIPQPKKASNAATQSPPASKKAAQSPSDASAAAVSGFSIAGRASQPEAPTVSTPAASVSPGSSAGASGAAAGSARKPRRGAFGGAASALLGAAMSNAIREDDGSPGPAGFAVPGASKRPHGGDSDGEHSDPKRQKSGT